MDLTQFVGARLVGKTLIGRATVQVLAMNAEEPLLFRIALLQAGVSSFLLVCWTNGAAVEAGC
jgi:hypothetical protein